MIGQPTEPLHVSQQQSIANYENNQPNNTINVKNDKNIVIFRHEGIYGSRTLHKEGTEMYITFTLKKTDKGIIRGYHAQILFHSIHRYRRRYCRKGCLEGRGSPSSQQSGIPDRISPVIFHTAPPLPHFRPLYRQHFAGITFSNYRNLVVDIVFHVRYNITCM